MRKNIFTVSKNNEMKGEEVEGKIMNVNEKRAPALIPAGHRKVYHKRQIWCYCRNVGNVLLST